MIASYGRPLRFADLLYPKGLQSLWAKMTIMIPYPKLTLLKKIKPFSPRAFFLFVNNLVLKDGLHFVAASGLGDFL
jgi:hypothetical protein